MGSSEPLLTPGISHELVVVHRNAELRQALHELGVALPAVLAKRKQLALQRPVAVLHEIDENVNRGPGSEPVGLAGHLAAGDEGHPGPLGRSPGFFETCEVVVVGEGDRFASGRGGELRNACRSVGSVRDGRMRVKIDHRGPR